MCGKNMTDITVCVNRTCPLKETCYRYNCPKNEYRQAYFEGKYKNGECEYYWKELY